MASPRIKGPRAPFIKKNLFFLFMTANIPKSTEFFPSIQCINDSNFLDIEYDVKNLLKWILRNKFLYPCCSDAVQQCFLYCWIGNLISESYEFFMKHLRSVKSSEKENSKILVSEILYSKAYEIWEARVWTFFRNLHETR